MVLLQTALFAWVPILLGLAGLDVGVDLHKIIRVSVGRDNFHTWGGSDAPEENIAYAAANLFADSAREFAACLEGDDDIDLVQYAAATRQYLEILKLFGKFTAVSIGEVESNLKKVERAAGGRFRTMKALLRDEVERGIHGANAKLKDESAAMGLLWVRRGLGFWAELFELPDAELGRSLKAAVLKAYEPTVAPFHGWVARRGFLYCAGSAPDWVALSPSLAPSAAALHDDLRVWVRVLRLLNDRMRAIHEELGLEDERKTI